MKLTLIFIFFCFILTGCGDGSGKVTTGTGVQGTLKLYKSCTGGGSISIYQKSPSSTTGYTAGGTTTLKGSGLKMSQQGCPSTVSFQCTGTGLTEAAFGNNVLANERFICNSGKFTFSPVYSTQTSLNPYPNTYPTNTYTRPTTTSRTYQSSAEIPKEGSIDIWLLGQGPLKKPSINGTLQFQITAGRYYPLPCGIQFVCP